MWSGYFKLGGNEVGNSARTLGYTRTSDCPINWLRDRDCGGLVEAIGDIEYTYDRVEEAPWYDPDDPEVTGRFLGAYVVTFEGVSDSTRAATVTEKNTDGAQVSGYRHTSREVRVRMLLTANGMDALESGMTWLRNVLEPDACGTHGTDCGASDMEFFVDCPPSRGFITTLGDLTEIRRNYFPDPRGTATDAWAGLLGDLTTVLDMPGDIETGVRWTRNATGTGQIRMIVGTTMPTESTVHFIATIRASEAMTIDVALRPAVSSATDQVLLVESLAIPAGITNLEFTGDAFTPDAGSASGITILVHGGAVSSYIDVNEVLIEGAAAGLYFDGSFEDEEDVLEYTWDGDENESQSVYSVYPTQEVPETAEEYAARVDERRRYLHTVTCISGPLVQQTLASSDKTHFGYLVEFTLLAAVPFVFGITKQVEVPPLTPSVLQDTPFNLVTYPSAELSSSAPSMVDATAPAGTKVTIPTHVSPAGGQVSDAAVVDFGTTWNGYRYWMAVTPYPNADDTVSDPNIVASTNGTTWVVPAGLVNPIDDQPGGGDATNSDPELVIAPGGDELWLLWETYDPDATGVEKQMWLSTSTDGVDWSTKELVYEESPATAILMSPTLIWEDDGWTMYAIDSLPSPNRLVRLRSEGEPMDPGSWSAPEDCDVTLPGGREPWHIYMRLVGGQYVGFLNDTVTGTLGTLGDNYVITSDDGTDFERGATVAIPRLGGSTPGHQALERAAFVVKDSRHLDVFYTGYNTGSPQVWNVFRTTATAPATSAAVVAATNYSPNPSVENNRTDFTGDTDVVSGDDPTPYFSTSQWVANPLGIDSLRADGQDSFLGEILGDGATSDAGRSYVFLEQIVPIPTLPDGTRMSFSVWAASVIIGGASGSTINGVTASAIFRDGVSVLSTISLGSAGPSEYDGKVYSVKSELIPADADNVLMRVRFDVSWTSSATPSLNSRIMNAIDAVAVTVP